MPQLDIDALRQAVAAGDYRITIHAKDQLAKRTVMVTEAKRVITDGAVIEQHLDESVYLPWARLNKRHCIGPIKLDRI